MFKVISQRLLDQIRKLHIISFKETVTKATIQLNELLVDFELANPTNVWFIFGTVYELYLE